MTFVEDFLESIWLYAPLILYIQNGIPDPFRVRSRSRLRVGSRRTDIPIAATLSADRPSGSARQKTILSGGRRALRGSM
ncbi:MAG: hypothetical protein WBN03_11340, partial [Desulfobacterales bacterium]